MSLHTVFYEFQINKQNVEYLVEDLQISQKSAPAVINIAKNLIELVNASPSAYAKVEVYNQPGLMLRFSRRLQAERLPHPIEGIHAFIHPSSEGHLTLKEFRILFETSLERHEVPYQIYE